MNDFNEYNNDNSFHNMSTSEYMQSIASRNIQTYDETYNHNMDYGSVEDSNITYVDTAKTKSGNGFLYYFKRGAIIAVGALIFGAFAGLSFNWVTEYKEKDKQDVSIETTEEYISQEITENVTDESTSEPTIEPVATLDGSSVTSGMDVSEIAEAVMPSTVSINIKSVEEYGSYWGPSYEYESEGSGSGIIIGENDTELLIVTNNHVVSGADTVSVTFIDESVYEAKVKGTDADNDLAIIVVDLSELSSETKSSIKVAMLGNSDELKVGEQVVAIGNSLGYGQSVTTGIVSALNRITDTNVTPLIQTDAAINPGNSGGALLNMRGEVIGINSSKFASTEVEGMGYAIPITQVEAILTDLMSRETREKVGEENMGYLGVGCQTIDEDMSSIYGMPEGALVVEVYKDTPAYKAGIRANNIIVELDGQQITGAEDLIEKLEYYSYGEVVEVVVSYLDDDVYKEKTIEIKLARRPQ